MLAWFDHAHHRHDDDGGGGGETSWTTTTCVDSGSSLDELNSSSISSHSLLHHKKPYSPLVRVAIYDATNSTHARRLHVLTRCQSHSSPVPISVMFIESICTDQELIMANIRQVKLSSPDYAEYQDPEMAMRDFCARIKHYEDAYESVGCSHAGAAVEEEWSFVKLWNVATRVVIHQIHGYLQSRVVYYLMNLHIVPKSILMCRHGESGFNELGRIGGDADLSEHGREFARLLPGVIERSIPAEVREKMVVWTSTLKRTIQTSEHLPYPKLQWKALDELDAGVCDGLTYDEIAEQYPEDFKERDKDKFHYRYPGGESYHDLILRLEPIIMELERQNPQQSGNHVLIIGHQAVLRGIYAYLMGMKRDELPYVHVPLHTLVKVTPRAYGQCEEEMIRVPVQAVDTHRPRPQSQQQHHHDGNGQHLQRSSYGDKPVKVLT